MYRFFGSGLALDVLNPYRGGGGSGRDGVSGDLNKERIDVLSPSVSEIVVESANEFLVDIVPNVKMDSWLLLAEILS